MAIIFIIFESLKVKCSTKYSLRSRKKPKSMRLRHVNLYNPIFLVSTSLKCICVLINVAISHSTCRTRVKDPKKRHKVTSKGPTSPAAEDLGRTRRVPDEDPRRRGTAEDPQRGPAEDLQRTRRRLTEDPPKTLRGPNDDSQRTRRGHNGPAEDQHRCLLSEVNNFEICRTY